MFLKNITIKNFRSYKNGSFDFQKANIIFGKNTIGKTNILEAIYYLSNGTSFRAENEKDVIKTGEDFARVEGKIEDKEDSSKLNVVLHNKNNHLYKKYLVNDVPKRQVDFISNLLSVLFTPSDIEIITDSPGLRRRYIDTILTQASSRYRIALHIYEKALKQRNRMLYLVKEGKRIAQKAEFEYWDNLLVENGSIITQEREDLIDWINSCEKNTFSFSMYYDKSTITPERIHKYFETEQKTGVTLIGPQRDDFVFLFRNSEQKISEFGSRGEQRLTILQVKLLEIEYLKTTTGKNPVLLLDDVFSELDSDNISRLLEFIDRQQTIITTTHEEFIPHKIEKSVNLIKLN